MDSTKFRHPVRTVLYIGLIALGIGSIGPHRVSAQEFRNITGFSVENYFDNTFGTRLENVFIAPLVPEQLQIQVKVSNETDNKYGDSRSLSMIHTGPIVIFGGGFYGLATYGAGVRETGSLVHEVDAQLHYETARFRVGGGARGHIEPNEDVAYVVPSIGGRVQITDRFGFQTTYFLGVNNDGDISNSVWGQGDYRFGQRITAILGASVELGDDVAWPDDNELTYNILSGIGFAITDSVSARYQFDYIRRAAQSDGIRNFVFIDWRF